MVVIKDTIINLLNYRIEQEELSARLYKSMSIWLNKHGFIGASKLWDKYSIEETTHAKWAYDYLLSLNIQPMVPTLMQPQLEFKGLPNIIALSYQHEVDILNQLQELADASQVHNDYMTLELVQRYLKEQVEEIEKTTTFIDKLEAFGDDKVALRLLDNEMGGM